MRDKGKRQSMRCIVLVLVIVTMIARVTVFRPAEKIIERKPVLLLTVKNPKPSTIRMSYIAQGLSWAPSYRLDISGEKELTIEQKAIIKNELAAFSDAEVFLISGFPSVQFGHVTSPLSLQQTWATFFQQLNTQTSQGHGNMSQVLQQQAVTLNTTAPGGLNMSANKRNELTWSLELKPGEERSGTSPIATPFS
ncbi:MAG: hypothetical protein PHO37_07200 [Kiritimatiellae bacterium]|nr:hypothetical protein [Kiritimatiellia bacterium]